MSKASERICDVLIEAGIDHVFGIPGGGTIPIWDALYDRTDKIKPVLCRHEQAAACMADMYGRLTGKPGVLMGQGAFIASNGSFGIIEGYLSNTPMLILTDTSDMGFSQHANYQSGTGEYGSFDIAGIMRSMSKYTTCATTPQEVVHGVQFAIKHALAGRPGPACVVMRSKAITGEIDPERSPRIHPLAGHLPGAAPVPAQAELEKAVQLIAGAARPVIIAGNGVHLAKAYGELLAFAECLGAPVTTSYKGKSTFPEIHPLALGMMGTFGQKVANKLVAEADVLIVAGCHMGPSDTRFDNPQFIDVNRQRIIQIDIDPRNVGWTYPVALSLVGDVKWTLGELRAKLQDKLPAAALRERQAAVAAKILQPGRPVLSVAGDGGFAMVPHVLATAVQYAAPVVFVVMNNSILGMVHNLQSTRQRVIASEFVPMDFAAIGKAYGCRGVKVTASEQLVQEIRKGFEADVPTVLDVATDRAESFLKIAIVEDLLRTS